MDNAIKAKEILKNFGLTDDNGVFRNEQNAKNFEKGEPLIAVIGRYRHEVSKQPDGKLFVASEELDQNLRGIFEEAQRKPELIQYVQSSVILSTEDANKFSVKAFMMGENKTIKEFDLLKHHRELLAEIDKKAEPAFERNKMYNALETLKGMLQFKMMEYPMLAKQLSDNINIVSEVMDITSPIVTQGASMESEVRLDVNDPDLYQDANEAKEISEEEDLDNNIQQSMGYGL